MDIEQIRALAAGPGQEPAGWYMHALLNLALLAYDGQDKDAEEPVPLVPEKVVELPQTTRKTRKPRKTSKAPKAA